MNLRSSIIIIAIFLLILGLGIISVLSFSRPKTEEPYSNASFSGSLFGNTTTSTIIPHNTASSATSTDTLEVSATTGTMLVRNFTHASDVLPSFDGNVYISYPADVNKEVEYEINYLSSDHSFSIVLAKEPIGETRRKAAEDLKNRLGVSDKNLCTLIADVRVPIWVNDFYAGINLGFPGCPESVKFDGDPILPQ